MFAAEVNSAKLSRPTDRNDGPRWYCDCEKLWSASRKESRIARTVVLKLKTREFKILTRSHTPCTPPSSCEELTEIAVKLRERVDLDPQQRFRLVGVGLSNFSDSGNAAAQPVLFEVRD